MLYQYNINYDPKTRYQAQFLCVVLVPFFLLTYIFMNHNDNNNEIPSFMCYGSDFSIFFSFAFLFANKKVHNSMRK